MSRVSLLACAVLGLAGAAGLTYLTLGGRTPEAKPNLLRPQPRAAEPMQQAAGLWSRDAVTGKAGAPQGPGSGAPPPGDRGPAGVGTERKQGGGAFTIPGGRRLPRAATSGGRVAAEPGGVAGGGAGASAAAAPSAAEGLASAERARHLPDAAEHAKRVLDPAAAQAESQNSDRVAELEKEEVLLSLPLRGDAEPEIGDPPLTAEGLVVNGGDVEFSDQGVLHFPAGGNVNGEAGTLSFEIAPKWAGSDPTNHSFVQILQGEHTWENRMALVKNIDSLRFIMIDNTGVERNVGMPIPDWEPGAPHRITATWGDALMTLYVDGNQVGQTTYQGALEVSPGSPVYIGYNNPASDYRGPGGTIRDFKIWGRALGAEEIWGQ
jgi:hypothetical protein